MINTSEKESWDRQKVERKMRELIWDGKDISPHSVLGKLRILQGEEKT